MSGGFFPAPEEIVRELGPAPAVLYGRIWRYCQGGGTCYASLTKLAEECQVTERTVRRWVVDLVDAGYITQESGRSAGTTNVITTTRKWIMGGDGQDVQGGRTKCPTRVGQNVRLLKEVEEKREDKRKDIAPHVTALASSPAPVDPKPAKPRAPRPMFDAFMDAFPKAPASIAGRFDAMCSEAKLTVDRWHAFMADPKIRASYTDGFLTRNNAGDRFHAWATTSKRNPTRDVDDGGVAMAARGEAWLKANGYAR